MAHKITRRDFLNGTQIAIGAALTPSLLQACGVAFDTTTDFTLPAEYYPPTKVGLRGAHDGSWEVMHDTVSGKAWKARKPEAHYDLVIVGGGISGLSAAYFFRQKKPNARILMLDNHDDFGGHAKRNEFEINGETRITYGGSEAIDTPSNYTNPAKALLEDIGIELKKFYEYYDQEFWARHKLSMAIFFDKEQFGVDRLVPGYGKRDWAEIAAELPISDKAKADFLRVQTEKIDYLAGMAEDEKIALMKRTSYEDFLRDYCKVDEEVIAIYKRWGMSFWCVGIDEIPTTLIQDYDGGMPGVEHTIPRTGHRNNEPYIFHFPDGNASVARLLVRRLLPEAVPGSTMEDVVTARVDYSKLDQPEQQINIRLNSTVVNAKNQGKDTVKITYVRAGKTHAVSADHCIMACYNNALPYLCPDMADAQVDALGYAIKVPLVYTKVLVPDWKRFAEIGTGFIYYPTGFYKQAEFAYPVSFPNYAGSMEPDQPMVLHMCHSPWVPDIQGPDQWREGRRRILSTPFSEYEHHVKTQLGGALAGYDFDPDRDITAITVNRWPHGYAYNPTLIWEPEYRSEAEKPWVIGRQPIGRIHIANSDAGAGADTNTAITQANRAVSEILG